MKNAHVQYVKARKTLLPQKNIIAGRKFGIWKCDAQNVVVDGTAHFTKERVTVYLRKLIKQLREFSPRRNNYYIEWTIKFITDDEYLLALIPTIQFEPWIYRSPNCPVIDVTWMHKHILIGTWRSKDVF